MTRDDIIRMAREVVGDYTKDDYWPFFTEELERFADLVAAAEREACAKVCEDTDFDSDADFYRPDFAAAIRARGETK